MKEKTKIVDRALLYIAENDEVFANLVKEEGIPHAAYKLLKRGHFNLESLHNTGDLRLILDALL